VATDDEDEPYGGLWVQNIPRPETPRGLNMISWGSGEEYVYWHSPETRRRLDELADLIDLIARSQE
jgi:hypothetical protein